MRGIVTLLSLAFLIVGYTPVTGQQFSLGVKAGPSITTGRFKDSDLRDKFNTRPVIGFTAGGLISFPLKGRYSFISEFAYSQSGKKIKFNNNEWTNTATFNFIDLSMALRRAYEFRLGPNIKSDVFLNVGPKISYWLGAKGKIQAAGDPTDFDIVFGETPGSDIFVNYYNNPNRWLFGIDFGAGINAPITSTQKVFVEVRASLGQTNLGKTDSSSTMAVLGFEDDLRMNLKTLSVIASYTFDFDLKKSKMGRSTKDRSIRKERKR
ncbi:MAG: porin family protein [Cyclobacteriaceae bacterium]